MPAPLPLRLYSGLTALVGPLLYRRISRKLRRLGTPPQRVAERKGLPTKPRPQGTLLWCHAASVGESLSVLRLITHLGEAQPMLSFLLTSGTATSAQIVAGRLPARTQHQFAPMDTPRAVDRFLDHWSPNAAMFVESELWPNMLGRTQSRGVPLALVNARLSDRSARRWTRARATARHLLGHFRMIHCQDARTAGHLKALGLTHAAEGTNLKAVAEPLPIDTRKKSQFIKALAGRPLWLAASTHPGEDDVMLAAHKQVMRTHPQALLLLVPRHPDRADDILAGIEAAGLTATQRSVGADPSPDTAVYLADTLGETGLWYAVSPITCLCGSFAPVGGHNPFEPAHGGSAILHGPRYANFAQVYAEFDANGAALEVRDPKTLGKALLTLMADPAAQATMTANATALLLAQEKGLDQIASDLSKALELG